MKYQTTSKCEGCGKIAWCLYASTGPFRGTWRCYHCQKLDSDAIADIVKAAENAMRRQQESKQE